MLPNDFLHQGRDLAGLDHRKSAGEPEDAVTAFPARHIDVKFATGGPRVSGKLTDQLFAFDRLLPEYSHKNARFAMDRARSTVPSLPIAHNPASPGNKS